MLASPIRDNRALAALVAVMMGACGSSEPDLPPGPDAGPVPNSDELYRTDRVWDVRIEVDSDAVSSLRSDPRTYVIGDVMIGDEILRDVGVRLKGGFSFRPFDGKAAFKIKFNVQDSDRRWLGLEGITLNNLWQDRSFVHENIAYSVFRAAGVPAPRTGFVRLHVNGDLYGLYANIESIDDQFLDRNFADGSGNLYEGEFGEDLRPENLWDFEQDEGADTDRADLSHLIDVVGRSGDEIFFGAEQLLDTRAFLAEVASEAITGHWDGYWKGHNYRIYHEPTLKRWSLIPWGIDQSFEWELGTFDGAGLLTKKCMELPTCLAEYVRVALEVVQVYESLDLASEIDRIAPMIEPYASTDPKTLYAYSKIQRHQAWTRWYVQTKPARMRAQLDCIENGAEVDRDNDGFGGCFADCNDSSAQAKPGGTEICDGLDNDCNGMVDDLPQCTCQSHSIDGTEFLFCANAFNWTLANAHCVAQGARLATIDSAAQNQAVWERSQQIGFGPWYIGLNDINSEGSWEWADGESPSYLNWPEGEPDSHGSENCVQMDPWADGEWTDTWCARKRPFICRVP